MDTQRIQPQAKGSALQALSGYRLSGLAAGRTGHRQPTTDNRPWIDRQAFRAFGASKISRPTRYSSSIRTMNGTHDMRSACAPETNGFLSANLSRLALKF